jgi:exodeoxyribonuclease V alpha subunit
MDTTASAINNSQPDIATSPPNRSPERIEQLSGTIASVVFHVPETGYCVLRVSATGHKKQITLTGNAPAVSPGEFVEASGCWETHPKYGEQFKADELRVLAPKTVNGLVRFLGSGVIKGIGKSYAKKLAATFGERLPEIIDNNPSLLESVPGIGHERRKQIVESWNALSKERNILIRLNSYKIGDAIARRIYKRYGDSSEEIVRRNPYQLCADVDGIAFKTADDIAAKVSIPLDSIIRIRAGVIDAVKRISAHGDCMMPKKDLIEKAIRILSDNNAPVEIKEIDVEQGLNACLAHNELVEETVDGEPCYYLPLIYRAEKAVAAEVSRILRGTPPWPKLNTEVAIDWVQKRTGIYLSPSQKRAVVAALEHKFCIVTGGPGVGKSTIMKVILMILRAKGVRILLAAPTGRAARRLSDATGMEATTIHRLLGYNGRTQRYNYNKDNRLPADLIVIDEASMVGLRLAKSLLQSIPDTAGLLLTGDVDQLGSIDQGAVLFDLIDSQVIPVSRLVEIHRQGEGSDIVTAAQMINQGIAPKASNDGVDREFQIIECESPEDIEKRILDLVTDIIPVTYGFDPRRDVQVLTALHDGSLGTISLNQKLQHALGVPGAKTLRRGGIEYREGDKIFQTVNNHDREVYNGDIGIISEINHESKVVTIAFDGRVINYTFAEMNEIRLSWALQRTRLKAPSGPQL